MDVSKSFQSFLKTFTIVLPKFYQVLPFKKVWKKFEKNMKKSLKKFLKSFKKVLKKVWKRFEKSLYILIENE